MFDSTFSTADDATVIAAIEEGARAEAAAGARRLAAIAELARRRVDDDDERANWAFDGWAFRPRRSWCRIPATAA
jgi:hypothetical protein